MHRASLVGLTGLLSIVGLVGPSLLAAQATPEPKWYERLRFDGDFRLRYEHFIQEDTDDRGRFRIRLRAGFTLPLTSTLTTGFRLATSEPGVVTSHNVSLTGALSYKNIFIDRAYITWTPSGRFTITGGKIAVPLQRPAGLMRSELLWDEELAPEGFHEQVTLVSNKTGFVRRFALLGEQWTLSEFADTVNVWMVGGQAVLDLALGGQTSAMLTGGFYDYINGQLLARSRNSNPALTVTNTVLLGDGTIVEPAGPLVLPAGAVIDRFVDQFKLISGAAGISIDSLLGRMPLQLYVDVVHNTGADVEQNGVWAGVTAGVLRRSGDWAASLIYARVERESNMSMFSYSDLGLGGSNVEGPILYAAFRPVGPLTLSYKHHYTRFVDPPTGSANHRLHRIMVDASVSF